MEQNLAEKTGKSLDEWKALLSTKTRVDLGLKFNDRPHGDWLESIGPYGAMCTHRVQLTDASQVDNELLEWVKAACKEAG